MLQATLHLDATTQSQDTGLHAKAQAGFAELFKSGALPALEAVQSLDDLSELEPLVAELKSQFKTFVVLGTGGSSLGGKTLYQLTHPGLGIPNKGTRVLFMDNIDPMTFSDLFASIDWASTLFISISKSGSTAETLSQTLLVMRKIETVMGRDAIAKHLLCITEKKDSPLTRIAETHGCHLLEHHNKIGGRFSVFSITGTLPALLAGLDVRALRAGAQAVLDQALADATSPALDGAVQTFNLNKNHGVTKAVMIPYLDRLDLFCAWYRQLWAESLGKQGQGITPIRALGTVDQHSQTQLYLDGPRDKFFTFITCDFAGQGEVFSAQDADLAYLDQMTMGDLMVAEQQATIDTLREKNCPVRQIQIKSLDETTLGALLMHFMIETIATAALMEIDAFDQPAVERGKVLTREYLADMRR